MRLQNWQLKFAEYIAAKQNVPFQWGVQDCATFSAGCVEAITGVNPLPEEWKNHSNEEADTAEVERLGGLAKLAFDKLGEEINPMLANVGDAVILELRGQSLFGICNGTTAVTAGQKGLISVPMKKCTHCWRIN